MTQVLDKQLPAAADQFNSEQIDLIKRTICKDATNDELSLFVQQCRRTKLDPFTKQIYFIKDKKGKANVMASIDGLRLIAERSGKYAGQTPPMWCGDDGVWTDVWLKKEPPVAARVGVYKQGFVEPLYAVAKFTAYAQNPSEYWSTWNKMPDHMIAKVAESLALRKAFPNEMSGVYGEEEFGQDSKVAVSTNPKGSEKKIESGVDSTQTVKISTMDITPPETTVDAEIILKPVTRKDIVELFNVGVANQFTVEEIDIYLKQEFGIDEQNPTALTRQQYDQALLKFAGVVKQ